MPSESAEHTEATESCFSVASVLFCSNEPPSESTVTNQLLKLFPGDPLSTLKPE